MMTERAEGYTAGQDFHRCRRSSISPFAKEMYFARPYRHVKSLASCASMPRAIRFRRRSSLQPSPRRRHSGSIYHLLRY